MKTSETIPSDLRPMRRGVRGPTRGGVLIWILASLAASIVLAAIFVLNTITLNHEARTIREAVVRALGVHPSTKVQVSVGPLMLGSARTILGFIDRVPEEAREALESVRSASVGVYRLNDGSPRRLAPVLDRVDAAMKREGWSRVVGVVEPQQDKCVLIYAPEGALADGPLSVCVAVCDRREFVVVSARMDANQLAKLVARHAPVVRL